MAVTLTIGERPFEVAPYKLKELRKVAPHVEHMNALAKRIADDIEKQQADNPDKLPQQNLEDLFDLARTLCEILAPGLQKIDPSMDADWLEEQVDISFLNSLQTAARAILAQSGLSSKNAAAPSPSPETGQALEEEASPANSEELSPS